MFDGWVTIQKAANVMMPSEAAPISAPGALMPSTGIQIDRADAVPEESEGQHERQRAASVAVDDGARQRLHDNDDEPDERTARSADHGERDGCGAQGEEPADRRCGGGGNQAAPPMAPSCRAADPRTGQ